MPRKGENIRKRKDGRWEGRYKCGFKENGGHCDSSITLNTYVHTSMSQKRSQLNKLDAVANI